MRAIFLDIETTGLDPRRHKAIDIALQVVDVRNSRILASYNSVIAQDQKAWDERDLNSIEINGYTFADVLKGKSVSEVGCEIIELLTQLQIERGAAVFICQNPSFDRSFFSQLIDVYAQERLKWPYHWLDLASMYWAHLIHKSNQDHEVFPEKLSLSKNDIASAYHLPTEETPHRAKNGVNHLMRCYEAVLGVQIR